MIASGARTENPSFPRRRDPSLASGILSGPGAIAPPDAAPGQLRRPAHPSTGLRTNGNRRGSARTGADTFPRQQCRMRLKSPREARAQATRQSNRHSRMPALAKAGGGNPAVATGTEPCSRAMPHGMAFGSNLTEFSRSLPFAMRLITCVPHPRNDRPDHALGPRHSLSRMAPSPMPYGKFRTSASVIDGKGVELRHDGAQHLFF